MDQSFVSVLIEASAKWGLGVVLAIIIVLMFKKFANRVMDDMSEERKLYKSIIDGQTQSMQNHVNHLTDSVNKNIVSVEKQGVALEGGLKNVVNAIDLQTTTLKEMLKYKETKNG